MCLSFAAPYDMMTFSTTYLLLSPHNVMSRSWTHICSDVNKNSRLLLLPFIIALCLSSLPLSLQWLFLSLFDYIQSYLRISRCFQIFLQMNTKIHTSLRIISNDKTYHTKVFSLACLTNRRRRAFDNFYFLFSYMTIKIFGVIDYGLNLNRLALHIYEIYCLVVAGIMSSSKWRSNRKAKLGTMRKAL